MTAEALRSAHRGRLARARELAAQVAAGGGPFDSARVLEPLNDAAFELATVSSECGLLAEVHPDPAVREAAEDVDREASMLRTEILQQRAIYRALEAVDPAALDPIAARVRALTLRDMERAGVTLDEAERAGVRALQDELLALEQEFNRNIRDDVRAVQVGAAELAGLPDDYVAAHPPAADGRHVITTRYPDYIPFMSYSDSDEARRRLAMQYLERATPRNLAVLRSILEKRQTLARLLGYASWADYATADKMSGSADAAREFIERVYEATRESAAAEREAILARKRRADPDARGIGLWEHAYWVARLKAEAFAFDPRSVRPYFEYRRVKQAMFDLASRLFGLAFARVDEPEAWDPAVETYAVRQDGRPMGRISLDMHPREGKFSHAACFTWRPGGRTSGVHAVLVCNFPDPSATEGPALMDHGEVVTFFHEFGHLVHEIAHGAIPWVRVSGVAEWDFVEAPSQLLEEWIYDAEVLRTFATHVDTGEPIPEETVAHLRRARDFGRGLSVQRQLFFSAVSLALHERPASGIDTTSVVFELAARYSPTELIPGTHLEASFGHLEGYSALYYTYMWSLVIAKDMLGTFRAGLLDTIQARRYRDLVLAPGGTKPAAALVRDFLGRPYAFDAFREWLAPR